MKIILILFLSVCALRAHVMTFENLQGSSVNPDGAGEDVYPVGATIVPLNPPFVQHWNEGGGAGVYGSIDTNTDWLVVQYGNSDTACDRVYNPVFVFNGTDPYVLFVGAFLSVFFMLAYWFK